MSPFIATAHVAQRFSGRLFRNEDKTVFEKESVTDKRIVDDAPDVQRIIAETLSNPNARGQRRRRGIPSWKVYHRDQSGGKDSHRPWRLRGWEVSWVISIGGQRGDPKNTETNVQNVVNKGATLNADVTIRGNRASDITNTGSRVNVQSVISRIIMRAAGRPPRPPSRSSLSAKEIRMRHMLLLVAIALVLLAPPVLAAGPEALFTVDPQLFSPNDSARSNASFIAVKARLTARQALNKPTSSRLVETGGISMSKKRMSTLTA